MTFYFLEASLAAESLSYSGRLVNTNGSPVTGSVKLKVELAYSGSPESPICSQNFSAVPLTNGVFHLKVDFNCGTKSLAEVFSEIPANESASIRVTDVTDADHPKAYSYQALHAVPFSNVSDYAKQLVLQGTSDGQVLTWNNTGKKWEVGAVPAGGTVTNISVGLPLTITNPASTPVITIAQSNTTTNGYLSSADWNTFNNKQSLIPTAANTEYYRGDKTWQTLNTDAVAEGSNLYFTNARVLGLSLTGFSPVNSAISASDSVLLAFGKAQGQINAINTASNSFLVKNSTDSITGLVNVGTTGLLQLNYVPVGMNDAVNKSYADTKLDLTGGTVTGALNLNNVLNLKGATNYVTVKAHATTGTYNFILPQTAGSSGHVLQTDGAGNLSWINPSSVTTGTGTVNSASIVDASIVDADVSASAGIAQSKIANLTSDLAGKEPSITATTADKYYRGDKTFVTLDTSAVPENGNQYFTDTRAISAPLTGFAAGSDTAISATDSILQAFNKTQGQINNRVKKNGDTMSGILTLDSDLKIKGGSSYVTVRGNAASSNYNFILPSGAGSNGQVLQTDGSGNLSWSTPSTTATPSGAAGGDLAGTYPNPTVKTGLDVAKLSTGVVDNTEFNYLDGVTNAIQTQLNGKQASDTTLSSLAIYNANGFVTQIAADTFTGRSIVGTTNRVTVTNGNGVSGNPTIDIPTALLPSPLAGDANKFLKATAADTSAWTALASGDVTTALGFTPVNKTGDTMTGDLALTTKLRLRDSTVNYVELKAPTAVTAYTLTLPAAKATVAGQILTSDTSGNLSWTTPPSSLAPTGAAGGELAGTYPNPTIANGLVATRISSGAVDNTEFDYLNGVTSAIQTQLDGKQSLNANLTALSSYSTNGILVQTAANSFAGRSIAGTANRITVTNGNGVSANPTIDIPTALLPSPVAGDVGKFLKATAANTSVWTTLGSSDVTGALGYTPINKAGDTIGTGTIAFNAIGTLSLAYTPTNATDATSKSYVDNAVATAANQWTYSGGNVYRSSGYVGIGNNNPTTNLQIDTGISSTVYTGVLIKNGFKNWTLGNNQPNSYNNIFSIYDGTTSRLWISDTGNVGVGVTNPGYKLAVAGAISGGDSVAGNSEAASIPVWHSYLGASADPSVVYIPLAYNQTAASGIASSGFEGQISVYRGSTGTYNSGTQYDVAVRTAYSGPVIYRFNTFGYQTGAQLVTLTYSSASYIALQIPSTSSHDFYITGKWWAFKPFILDSVTHAGQVSAVTAYASTNLTTTAAGNVGIGTSSPAAKLEVAGGIKLGSMTACGAAQEGSQRYNSSLKIMEFCDGVAWQSFAGSSSVPTGAIMAFDLATCPSGWAEYTAARGRFLRGINGSGVDPAGNRSPGSLQAEDWRGFSMTNTIQGGSSGYSHGPVDMGKSTSGYVGNLFVGYWSTPMAALGTKWNAADETRPINVGVLFCRKN